MFDILLEKLMEHQPKMARRIITLISIVEYNRRNQTANIFRKKEMALMMGISPAAICGRHWNRWEKYLSLFFDIEKNGVYYALTPKYECNEDFMFSYPSGPRRIRTYEVAPEVMEKRKSFFPWMKTPEEMEVERLTAFFAH